MANPRINGGDKNRPSRVRYHNSGRYNENKIRRITKYNPQQLADWKANHWRKSKV